MKIQKYKKDGSISYALGATLNFELIREKPQIVRKVYVKSSLEITDSINELIELCKKHDIPIEKNDKAFNILSPKGNCFVIGEFEKEKQSLDKGSHVVLVNPSDAGNLGTIMRTATGFGLRNIAIIKPAADSYDPKTVRASMGALFHVNIEYFEDINDYITKYPENKMYAFMLTASKPIHNIKIEEPYSLVFGNEATGLPDEYATFCNSVIIPHSNDIDSLNLPIAASIAMYEFTKNKWEE